MIRVNEDWVIAVDSMNYIPMQDMHRTTTCKRKDGTITTEPYYKGGYGYYQSLKGAVKAIARVEYRNALTGQETPLNEAIKLMDETISRFEKILEGIRE